MDESETFLLTTKTSISDLTHGLLSFFASSRSCRCFFSAFIFFVALFMSFYGLRYLMLSAPYSRCGVKVHSHRAFVTFNKKNQLSSFSFFIFSTSSVEVIIEY